MFIITADHGEDLDGYIRKTGHGRNITEDEFRIPCIIYKGGLVPKKLVNHLTRSIDLFPTMLDLLEIKVSDKIDGISVKKSIFDDAEIVSEAFLESYPLYGDIKGIRTKDWLYILKDGKREELYNMNKNEKLKDDLAEKNKELCLKLRTKVKNHFSIKYEPGERDEYMKDKLRELGYVK
jgi:arylsulfatase A-like enzyme